jgi:hypothetical protein
MDLVQQLYSLDIRQKMFERMQASDWSLNLDLVAASKQIGENVAPA